MRFTPRPELRELLRQFTDDEHRDALDHHANAFRLVSRIYLPVDERKTVDNQNADRDFVKRMGRAVFNYHHGIIDFPVVPGVGIRQGQGNHANKAEIDMRLDLGISASRDILSFFEKEAHNTIRFADTDNRLLVPVYYVAPALAVQALAHNIEALREGIDAGAARAGGIEVISTTPRQMDIPPLADPIQLPTSTPTHNEIKTAS